MGKKQEIERLREQLNQWLVEEEHDNDEVWLKRGGGSDFSTFRSAGFKRHRL
ncbi:hypothetical protein [Geobacillus sp. CAMR5420]|uniref:hypothetical protein n=1 Tax=Geobacillus sp. CAMR5420 TaxID=1482739 RepID=UPI000AFA5540|nr:hypothetical protein [Geobacillus sp. CAMR5420]WJQ01097.1 hypothetical protein QT234_04395 [Geobacillus stearothermophilus]